MARHFHCTLIPPQANFLDELVGPVALQSLGNRAPHPDRLSRTKNFGNQTVSVCHSFWVSRATLFLPLHAISTKWHIVWYAICATRQFLWQPNSHGYCSVIACRSKNSAQNEGQRTTVWLPNFLFLCKRSGCGAQFPRLYHTIGPTSSSAKLVWCGISVLWE